MYSITSDAKRYLNEINLIADDISENSTSTENKLRQLQNLKRFLNWKRDGKVSLSIINTTFVLVIQSLPTRNFQANILENGADSKCRVFHKHTETIDHIVSVCPILATTEYVNRHDRLGLYIHWCLCIYY